VAVAVLVLHKVLALMALVALVVEELVQKPLVLLVVTELVTQAVVVVVLQVQQQDIQEVQAVQV
jgi:hypothetical protein